MTPTAHLSAPSVLTPTGTLELLDRAFRIYREHFVRFIVPVAIAAVPLTLLNLVAVEGINDYTARFAVDPEANDLGSSVESMNAFSNLMNLYLLFIGVTVVGAFAQGVLVNAPLTWLTSEYHLGRQATLRDAWTAVQHRLMPLAGGLLVFYLVIFAFAIGLAFILYACGLAFGLLAFVGVALYAFLTPVLVLEQVPVGLGVRRAWALAKARIWHAAGVILAVSVIGIVVNIAFLVIEQIVTQGSIAGASSTAADTLSIVLQSLIGVVIAPVLPISLTLMYYDTRVRLEGLDIVMQIAGKERPSEVVSPPPPRDLLTRRDVANIAIMCAVMFGIVLAYYALILLMSSLVA